MAFQLGLNRRVSLEDLAEGWGPDCYITLKVAGADEVRALEKQGLDKSEGDEAFEKLVGILAPRVVSARVMNTTEKGELEAIDVKSDEAHDLLRAFPIDSLRDFMQVCLGFTPTTTSTS